MASFGRRKIKSDVKKVTADNVVSVLKKALLTHSVNSRECQHLKDVRKGNQPILNRTKSVREEINNKVIINHADEIVNFKVSYLLSEPVIYVSRGTRKFVDEESKIKISDEVVALNEFMYLANKPVRDKKIADDFSIYGNAYRIALPNPVEGEDESPFNVDTLDARYTFIVYYSGIGKKPLCAVTYVHTSNEQGESEKKITYSVYTPNEYFEIKDEKITKQQSHSLGNIPIVEYINNDERLGAFEVVESILDTINTLFSNRVDATEQFVQALMVFLNCDIDQETFDAMREKGAIKIKSIDNLICDIKMLTADLKQADQQVLADALYNLMLKIVGMPTQAMESNSDSSNNGAMIVKNGWYHAEARAKDTELLWRESENNFLKVVLKICRDSGRLHLRLSDFTPKFTRRNYEDILVKMQVLIGMLNNEKISDRLAFTHCGLFTDGESAYAESMEQCKKNQPKEPGEVTEEIIVTEG